MNMVDWAILAVLIMFGVAACVAPALGRIFPNQGKKGRRRSRAD